MTDRIPNNEAGQSNLQDDRDALIESLLKSAKQPEDHADRIARAMDRLESESHDSTSTTTLTESPVNFKKRKDFLEI